MAEPKVQPSITVALDERNAQFVYGQAEIFDLLNIEVGPEATVAAVNLARTTRLARTGMVSSTTSLIGYLFLLGHTGLIAAHWAEASAERREDREELGEPGDLEDLEDSGLGHRDPKPSTGGLGSFQGTDQDAEGGRVDEGHPEEIGDHQDRPRRWPARGAHAGSGCGGDVQLSDHRHDGAGVVGRHGNGKGIFHVRSFLLGREVRSGARLGDTVVQDGAAEAKATVPTTAVVHPLNGQPWGRSGCLPTTAKRSSVTRSFRLPMPREPPVYVVVWAIVGVRSAAPSISTIGAEVNR